MYLSQIRIEGYKAFGEEFTAKFNKGINIIVGENGSGKSSILDAIRLLLCEDEYNRSGLTDSCFHRPISHTAKSRGADKIQIRAQFTGLSNSEQIAYLPWLDVNTPSKAWLNIRVENKEDYQGKYKRKVWGNESESGIFEWELLNRIHCIYLPPLRDAEEKLKAYRGSRLARLLKNLRRDEEEVHPLERKFSRFNQELLVDASIQEANQSIKDNVRKSVGLVFGQDTSIQFTEVNFNRIVERLKLLFYPLIDGTTPNLSFFRELNENSLGFNNILYISTILAELDGLNEDDTFLKVLLIEEPEAHLHPQLQIRLFKYLQEKAKQDDIQIIVTTHSPTLTSAIDLDFIKVVTAKKPGVLPVFTTVADCGFSDDSKDFLGRWLDITKSTLLFAKGVILVEGIAEALVLKELAKIVLSQMNQPNKIYHKDLDEYGISIINMNGIYFKHFFSLFQGYRKLDEKSKVLTDFIPIRCAGITDNDPKVDTPIASAPPVGTNPQLYLAKEFEDHSTHCRLFYNLKTFEYDLAIEGNNLSYMAGVQLAINKSNGPIKDELKKIQSVDWTTKPDTEKADRSYWILEHISKGTFAQKLAQELSIDNTGFKVPSYIVSSIKWVIE